MPLIKASVIRGIVLPHEHLKLNIMIYVVIILAIAALVLIFIRVATSNSETKENIGIGLAVVIVADLVFFLISILTIIPSGKVGVPVIFGKVQEQSVPEGLHGKNPFAVIKKMSIRTDSYTMSATSSEGEKKGDDAISSLSKDGLKMPMDVSIFFRLVGSDAPWIYQKIGSDYIEKMIRPAGRTSVRKAAAKFLSQEAYALKRDQLQDEITEILTGEIKEILKGIEGYEGKTGVIIQNVLLRNVEMPDKVKNAIEEKLAEEQDAQKMEFTLQKETKEAERKRIEAKGIQDFQTIVSKGISDKLLEWKGIEATEALAESPNAKIVIIGSPENGLPVILGK